MLIIYVLEFFGGSCALLFLAGIFCRPVYRAVHAIAPSVGSSMAAAFNEMEDIAT